MIKDNGKTKFIFQPYALTIEKSRGRIEKEKHSAKDFRTEFQHDRDRIIHAKAFRRLEAKTQVVLIHENDHTRNRLTHSLEVAQISEAIAIGLGLNPFLTSAIALGHDLGHAPFGHGGEKALNEIFEDFRMEGFKHNYQSILIVNKLEKRYNKNNGLNLLWETRDGILKHTGLKDGIALHYYDDKLEKIPDFPLTLEGQIVSIVDEIAQRTHDTDDGLRTNRIFINDLVKQKIIIDSLKFVKINKDDLVNKYDNENEIIRSELIISMIKFYVDKLLSNSKNNIKKLNINKYDDVLNQQEIQIIDFDDKFKEEDKQFKNNFLHPKYYCHHEIKRMDSRATYFIKQIFKAYKKNPRQLPENTFKSYINSAKEFLEEQLKQANGNYKEDIIKFLGNHKFPCEETCSYIPKSKGYIKLKRNLCPLSINEKRACEGIKILINHIAGMTDRYAHLEFSRLYFPPEISRL